MSQSSYWSLSQNINHSPHWVAPPIWVFEGAVSCFTFLPPLLVESIPISLPSPTSWWLFWIPLVSSFEQQWSFSYLFHWTRDDQNKNYQSRSQPTNNPTKTKAITCLQKGEGWIQSLTSTLLSPVKRSRNRKRNGKKANHHIGFFFRNVSSLSKERDAFLQLLIHHDGWVTVAHIPLHGGCTCCTCESWPADKGHYVCAFARQCRRRSGENSRYKSQKYGHAHVNSKSAVKQKCQCSIRV